MPYADGTYYEIGVSQGKTYRESINWNLQAFRNVIRQVDPRGTFFDVRQVERELPSWMLEEISGISEGSCLDFAELVRYNVFREIIYPDECTVLMAVGKASKSGSTIFLKNSDKIGDVGLTGPKFYRDKEVNVVLHIKAAGKNRVIGFAAAGSVDVKMGLSDKGVAAGTNISRTKALAQKSLSTEQVRVPGRGRLIREALESCENALSACNLTTAKILKTTMTTSGNLQFADAKEAYIIEGFYNEMAVETVRDKTAARSNCFVSLKGLNDEEDVSSICRLVRGSQLLRENEGKIDFEMMRRFSMDHANGPGVNSICRHSNDPADETSLGAAIMEIHPEKPELSKITITLGKPCRAWEKKEACITLDMAHDPRNIPSGHLDGETWKRFYSESPNTKP